MPPQSPQSPRRIWDGKQYVDENGNPVDQTQRGSQPGGLLTLPPGQSDSLFSQTTPKGPADLAATALKAGALGVGLIPGGGLLGAGLRIAVPTALDAEANILEGDPTGGGVAGDVISGAMSEFLPAPIRRAANWMGLKIGGVKGALAPVLDALERQNIPLASPNTLRSELDKAIEAEQQLEGSLQGASWLPNFKGYNPASKPPATQPNVSAPMTLHRRAVDAEKEFLKQQAERKMGQTAGSKPLKPGAVRRQINDTELSPKDLGDLNRSKINDAKALSQRTLNPRAVSPDSDPDLFDAVALAGSAQRQLETIAMANGKQQELLDLWNKLGDLDMIGDTNSLLNKGGGIITDIGSLGTRAGFAHGLLRNAQATLGVPSNPGSGVLPLLFLLNPRMLSLLGQQTSKAVGAAPSLLRGADVVSDAVDTAQSGVTLRKPGGGR